MDTCFKEKSGKDLVDILSEQFVWIHYHGEFSPIEIIDNLITFKYESKTNSVKTNISVTILNTFNFTNEECIDINSGSFVPNNGRILVRSDAIAELCDKAEFFDCFVELTFIKHI